MRTALAASAVLLAVAAGCGTDDSGRSEDRAGGTEATPVESASPAAALALAPAVTGPGTVGAPDLLQCLAQSGLPGWGPDPRTTGTAADYVDAQRLTFEAADNPGGLWVFEDAETAAAYGEYAFEAEKLDDVDPATAASELHGNVLLIATRPLASPATEAEQRLLNCLPDAAAPTAVLPPAPGTVTVGSYLACAHAAGLRAKGDVNDAYDATFGITATVDSRTAELDSVAYVRIFADAAGAAAYQAEATDVRAGNTVVSFTDGQPDPTVTACLPA